MDQSCRSSVPIDPTTNIQKSLPELSSSGYCNDEIENNRENTITERHQLRNDERNAFENNSSILFWKRNTFDTNPSDDSNRNSNNDISTTRKLSSRLNAYNNHSNQFIHSQNDNAFAESSPHCSVSGFPLDGSKGEHFDENDSNDREKRKLTRQHFVTVFSICYAMFLVIFSAIIFIDDVFNSQYLYLKQAVCIYMLLMAFAYFLYLFINIRLHVHRVKNELKGRVKQKQRIAQHIKNMNNDGAMKLDTMDAVANAQATRQLNLPSLEAIPHRYCFILGRHGASLYVKLGAAWFAFGLVIYSALEVSYDVSFISSYGNNLHECASYFTLVLDILFPIYTLFTLFFIVKYMNVVINVNQNLARIFLMHVIGTSFSLWVLTIVRETADAIAESDAEHSGEHRAIKRNETFEFAYNDCGKSNALNSIHRQFAPYLYPFVIEYCILVVGICCKIYGNMNRCPRNRTNVTTGNDAHCTRNDESTNSSPTDYPSGECEHISEHDAAIHTSFRIQFDCQSSFKGIFLGLIFLIMSIVCVILMFAGLQNKAYLQKSIYINNVFELCSLFCLIVCTISAYIQMMELNINSNLSKNLDMEDYFLLITKPAFFIESIFSFVPAAKNGTVLQMYIAVFRVVEVLIQTPFIIDGRRRCTDSNLMREKKPGREFVIFLTIANMSVWIYHTFSEKTMYANDECFAFYGYHLWNILIHICLPLKMFYRFHASVCLVDIWNHAYEPAESNK